ncbi:MAG: rod shape-determining protein RodA [Clostridia bacterium]|nr:rod shape-determining protein RodA [Clostridia bacterium]
MRISRRIGKLDKWLLLAVGVLTFIGLLGISSATRVNQGEYIELIKQLIFIILGVGVMIGTALINFTSMDDSLRNILAVVVYVLIILALILVIAIGSSGGGAVRWIKIGPVGIQPSEFAKIGLILVTAAGLDMIGDYINHPLYLIASLVLILIPAGLVFIQPNLSTCIIILTVFFIQLFTQELDYRYILIALGIGIPLIVAVFFYAKLTVGEDGILKNYQKKRILALVYPDEYSQKEAYQTKQAMQAIGSGKIFGKGLFKGILNKSDYVPEPHTDAILAVIGEEFGFIGTFAILMCYLLIAYRGYTLINSTNDTFIKQTVIGIVALFLFQSFVNIGVITGLLPNTGVTLPFVSAGGSSYLANAIAIGILLNIDLKLKEGYRFRR